MSDITSDFSLPRHHRVRLLGGDYSPIFYKALDPPKGCEKGATYVLSWARSSRTLAGDVVLELPRRPLRYLTISDVRRHPKAAGWMIRFNVEDFRDPELYMARGSGIDGTGYTPSRLFALEAAKVVHPAFQAKLSKVAYDRDQALRLERVAAGRTSRNRFRKERLKAVDRLRSAA